MQNSKNLRFSGFILYPLSFFLYSPFKIFNFLEKIREPALISTMIYTLFYLDEIIFQYLLHEVKEETHQSKRGILISVEGFMGTVVNRELSSLHESHLS